MRQTNIFRGFSLFMAFLFTGCASYAPVLTKLDPSGPNVSKQVNGDLTIYVEEYATPEKSEKAFDANLVEEGVLALLLSTENSGKGSYEIKTSDIVFSNGNAPLRALSAEEAASKAERSAVGRALGWSLIVPIISIPIAVAASAIHTSSVNDKIVQDFVAKRFQDGTINRNKQLSGFLFLELEEGRKDLSGLNLELAARNMTTGEIVTITTALPAATFTAVAQANPEEDEAEEP
jgi:hypothetical protein